MKRSKQSKAQLAQRAISAAIREETEGLRAESRAKDVEIARLRGLLTSIGQIASRGNEGNVPVIPQAVSRVEEVDSSEGPAAPLADEDNLGEGRWA